MGTSQQTIEGEPGDVKNLGWRVSLSADREVVAAGILARLSVSGDPGHVLRRLETH